MKHVATALLALGLLAGVADAAVLCAKPRESGGFNGNVKIRAACRRGEVQIAPEDVGFCCTATTSTSTTSSSTTTGSCPTYTSTSLGVPDCFGTGPSPGACNGLCANARDCVPDPQTNACGCTGPIQPCGVVTYNGLCGGSCPDGLTCQYYGAPLPNGCPGEPHCTCAPAD